MLDAPDNDLFSPREEQSSDAGMNYGDSTRLSRGLSPDGVPGGGLDQNSALGSDERIDSTRNVSGGDQALGSDSALGSYPASTPARPAATIGGESLLVENESVTTNSNVGVPADDTEAV